MKTHGQKIRIAEKHGWIHGPSTLCRGLFWHDPRGAYSLASTEKYHRITEVFRIIRKRDRRFSA